jgi:hypothetical protein
VSVAAYAIPSLTEVKNYIKIPSTDTALDTILESWIDRVSYDVETYCHRKFTVQSVSGEIHDGSDSPVLYTKFFPITQLSTETSPSDAQKLAAVQYRTSPDGSWTDIETDADHIFIDDDWPFIKLNRKVFQSGDRNIKVSYKAGYSIIPGKVWQVAVEMVSMLWKESNQSGISQLGKSSKTMSAIGSTFSEGLLDMNTRWKRDLDYYKVSKRTTSQTQVGR